MDDRYPRQTVYPGVRQFHTGLDKGGATEEDAPGDLIVLSARPNDHLGLAEARMFETLKSRGVDNPTALLGNLTGFATGLLKNEPIGGVKNELAEVSSPALGARFRPTLELSVSGFALSPGARPA